MMNKRLHRLLCVTFFLPLIVCVSCKKGGPGQDKHTETPMEFYSDGRDFFTADYALYHSNHGRLQFFDVSDKKDIVYCFDSGCEHKQEKRNPYTAETIEKGCIAYKNSADSVMLRGDEMYFFEDDGDVVVADRQGENRRVIATIPFYKLGLKNVLYSEDKMLICYSSDIEFVETVDENGRSTVYVTGKNSAESDCGVYCINLSDGAVSEVFHNRGYNGRLFYCDIRDNHLYFVFYYWSIPYIGSDLDTNGLDVEIPEGLTKENYWEESRKYQWMDVYDVDLGTNTVRTILSHIPSGTVEFCRGFFAVEEWEKGATGLYRYDGERFRQLDFEMRTGYRSDSGLICTDSAETGSYRLIDENTGEIRRQVSVSNNTMLPKVFIGGSCYGYMAGPKGWHLGYISEEDFWNGDFSKAIPFNAIE